MRKFALSKSVMASFADVALKRSSIPGITNSLCVIPNANPLLLLAESASGVAAARERILKLASSNAEFYRSDQLYKLIPKLVNPG